MNYFVTGIDTDSGKTLVSAILCEALGADYWKPIQAGFPTDTERVKELVGNPKCNFHKELYLLNTSASPHAAASIDGVNIKLDHFKIPKTNNHLVIEGAGGCLVPINDRDFVIDLVPVLSCEIILVADLYLGSINHTLLTVDLLKRRGYPVKGIIFNGKANPQSQSIILSHTGLRQLLHVREEVEISPQIIHHYAEELKSNWNK